MLLHDGNLGAENDYHHFAREEARIQELGDSQELTSRIDATNPGFCEILNVLLLWCIMMSSCQINCCIVERIRCTAKTRIVMPKSK